MFPMVIHAIVDLAEQPPVTLKSLLDVDTVVMFTAEIICVENGVTVVAEGDHSPFYAAKEGSKWNPKKCSLPDLKTFTTYS